MPYLAAAVVLLGVLCVFNMSGEKARYADKDIAPFGFFIEPA